MTAHERRQQRLQRDAENRIIYQMFLRGSPFSDLAHEFNQTEPQIRARVRKEEARVKAIHERDVDVIRQECTQRMERVIHEAERAWVQSQQPAEERVTGNAILNMRTGEVVDLPDKVTTRVQTGNVAYLNAIMAADKELRKMWGADAPEKREVSFLDEAGRDDLEARMSELIERTEDTQARALVESTAEPLSPLKTAREEMLEEVELTKQRKVRDNRQALLPSQKAETTDVGIDFGTENVDYSA